MREYGYGRSGQENSAIIHHLSPAASSPRKSALACLLAVVVSAPAHGFVTFQRGNEPLSPANYTDWPGIAEVINDESRIFHLWGNGNEKTFYRGDTTALARTLGAFATTAIEERLVILRPGRGALAESEEKSTFYDWELGLVGGISRFLLEGQDAELVWEKHPTLTVYVGGNLDLDAIAIPDGITLVGVDELRERYTRGIRSSNERVRRYSAQLLAEADPYGAESAAAVARLVGDREVQNASERALAEFKKRADDPADVRAEHAAEVQRIRRFVFAWRRRSKTGAAASSFPGLLKD